MRAFARLLRALVKGGLLRRGVWKGSFGRWSTSNRDANDTTASPHAISSKNKRPWRLAGESGRVCLAQFSDSIGDSRRKKCPGVGTAADRALRGGAFLFRPRPLNLLLEGADQRFAVDGFRLEFVAPCRCGQIKAHQLRPVGSNRAVLEIHPMRVWKVFLTIWIYDGQNVERRAAARKPKPTARCRRSN